MASQDGTVANLRKRARMVAYIKKSKSYPSQFLIHLSKHVQSLVAQGAAKTGGREWRPFTDAYGGIKKRVSSA